MLWEASSRSSFAPSLETSQVETYRLRKQRRDGLGKHSSSYARYAMAAAAPRFLEEKAM